MVRGRGGGLVGRCGGGRGDGCEVLAGWEGIVVGVMGSRVLV